MDRAEIGQVEIRDDQIPVALKDGFLKLRERLDTFSLELNTVPPQRAADQVEVFLSILNKQDLQIDISIFELHAKPPNSGAVHLVRAQFSFRRREMELLSFEVLRNSAAPVPSC